MLVPEIRAAPPVLEVVSISKFVSPSTLSPDSTCRLKARGRTAETGSQLPQLGKGPHALLGDVIHRTIQLADQRSNLLSIFKILLDAADEELKIDRHRSHLSPIRLAIGERDWNNRMAFLETRVGTRPPIDIVELRHTRSKGKSRNPGPHERWMESKDLGIAGSIDHLEVESPGTTVITDWKTGAIFDSAGEIVSAYRMQLAAYKLLCQEAAPNTNIKTVLNNGIPIEVDISQGDIVQTLEIVRRLSFGLEGGSIHRASELTEPGPECARCTLRHVCPAYRKNLEEGTVADLATSYGSVRDLQGSVRNMAPDGDLKMATLNSPTGSALQIRGLSSRFDNIGTEGSEILAFGFIPQFRQTRRGARAAPNTFREIVSGGAATRAWSAEAFVL